MSCPTLQPVSVSTGSVTLVTNGTTTTAQYSCPQGYDVKGSQTLTCNSDGTWNNEPSDCGKVFVMFYFIFTRKLYISNLQNNNY